MSKFLPWVGPRPDSRRDPGGADGLLRLELARAEVDEADEGAARVVEHAVPIAGQVLEGDPVPAAEEQHAGGEAGRDASRDTEQLSVAVAVHPEAALLLDLVHVVDLRRGGG